MQEQNAIIDVDKLNVSFETVDGEVQALSDVSFKVREGEILGIIGESGSGKSTLAMSLMSLLPENAKVNGSVKYKNEVITDSSNSGKAYFRLPGKKRKVLEKNLAHMRWKDISMVFQGAMNSLNPVYTVRYQVTEVFELHTNLTKIEINKRILEAAKVAGLNKKYLDAYPHELSGGMKQRAVLAMALALKPTMIIADEPTTGLDVITQAKIIRELKKLREDGTIKSMVIISHDVGVVSQLADRVAVLYAGRIMELGSPSDIYLNQGNPYSKALIESYPSIKSTRKKVRGIPGSVPDTLHLPGGCYFAERCAYSDDKCRTEVPPMAELGPEHHSLCHYAHDFRNRTPRLPPEEAAEWETGEDSSHTDEMVFEARDLTKFFQLTDNSLAGLFSRTGNRIVHAVDHVSLDARRGEIIGVVGESGSGKTTLGRTLLMSYKPTTGKLNFNMDGGSSLTDITRLSERSSTFRKYRRKAQLIFQDPYDSLNPKMSIFDIVSEPVIARKAEEDYDKMVRMINDALETANLRPPLNYINRYPHELSGGERQRVSIARSLVLKPDFLVADEPISMLDVSIRANVMNLLIKLRNELSMTIMYISHDIASARYVSDRLAVMYLGELMEIGPSEDVISNPLHPYTRALVEAVPVPDPSWSSNDLKIIGEIGSAIDVKKGCRFYDRCVYRKDVCHKTPPPEKKVGERTYRCHFDQDELVEEDMEELMQVKG